MSAAAAGATGGGGGSTDRGGGAGAEFLPGRGRAVEAGLPPSGTSPNLASEEAARGRENCIRSCLRPEVGARGLSIPQNRES